MDVRGRVNGSGVCLFIVQSGPRRRRKAKNNILEGSIVNLLLSAPERNDIDPDGGRLSPLLFFLFCLTSSTTVAEPESGDDEELRRGSLRLQDGPEALGAFAKVHRAHPGGGRGPSEVRAQREREETAE